MRQLAIGNGSLGSWAALQEDLAESPSYVRRLTRSTNKFTAWFSNGSGGASTMTARRVSADRRVAGSGPATGGRGGGEQSANAQHQGIALTPLGEGK